MNATSKELVRQSFSERADGWMACYAGSSETLEQKNLLSRQRIAVQLLDEALPRPARVLDAGCGSGELAAKLVQRNYDVHGIDIAAPMIHLAAARFGADRFQTGDIENLSFPDNAFDAVVSLGVIEYLDSDDLALREMRRVLKPGGIAIFATPNALSLLQIADGLAPHPVDGLRRRVLRPGEWRRVLRSHGFVCEKHVFHGWGWYRSSLGRLAVRMSRHLEAPRSRYIAAEQIVRVRVSK